MERPYGGFNRGNRQNNIVGAQQQAPIDRPQPTRQEDEWSLPPTVERRNDAERQQTTQMSPLLFPLLQKKDCLPTGVVKILQEKE